MGYSRKINSPRKSPGTHQFFISPSHPNCTISRHRLPLTAQHRWLLVQEFVDALNQHRSTFVSPSEAICVDESPSRWYLLGGHWIEKGLPHYVAMVRKPENGCELQDAACGRSGIMLRLELVTTAEDEKRRSDNQTHMAHGTAFARRLVTPWAGSGRVVCAVSYFASVQTAETIVDMGMKFIGVVKNATKIPSVVSFYKGSHSAW